MKITVGKYSGFCNGVNHTVTKTLQELENNSHIYSLGAIVHNKTVMDDLETKGLIVKESLDMIPNNSKVMIRAHGESLDTYQKAQEKHLDVIDLTCGKVRLIHHKILNHPHSFIIIIGKKNHPETIAHKSYSKNSFIVENVNDLQEAYETFVVSSLKSLYVVSQTTFNEILFQELVLGIQNTFKDIEMVIDNTICPATSLRQMETIELAKSVDKMIIIGGRNSSNTKELFNIAKNYCQNVYLIETYHDLDNVFEDDDNVGIMAGASTPDDVIREAVEYVKNIYKKAK